MVKSADPAMTIGPVRLLRKEGGRRGPWEHPDGAARSTAEDPAHG
jgi:cyclic pyranopterin phosphate synthase